jgi:signal transduction histidine kinase/CheY-like chemotaxis protein
VPDDGQHNRIARALTDIKPRVLDRRTLLLALALFAIVALTAYACVAFPRSQGRIAPIWLANAWVVAALLRTRMSRWPLLVVAAFAGNMLANHLAGDVSVVAGGLAGCNLLESLTCAWIVRRRCDRAFDIGRLNHLIILLVAALGSAVLSAMAAAIFLGMVDHADMLRGLAVWTESDALGLLTLAPSLLVITQRTRTPIVWRESWTLAVLTAVTVAVFLLSHRPLLFVVSAVLTLPTWRMGLPGAVAGFAIVAAVGALATFSGHGPIVFQQAAADQVIALQIFLTVSFLTSVPVAVARDAGESMKARLRAALAEARNARAEAEQAAAVKSEFLANMSHELRTPLTSVVGFTQLAAEQSDLTPLTRGYIDRVGDASKALLCAVNDILDFSKLEAGQVSLQPKPVAVGAIAQTTLDLFTPQAAAKDLSLVLEDATQPGLTVHLDPDRLRQVLLNLVGNAVKFTAQGQVTLKVGYDEATDGGLGRLALEVVDTGPGIPANRLDRLFKRFSQVDGGLDRGHGGTGLGLAICKGIVEAMGGEIGASSVVGKGSRFFLSVPAALAFTDAPATVADTGTRTPSGLRVLVTDDHPANRELVRLFLASIGAEITEAGDGEMATDLAANQAFDMILMDLRMPKLDGFGAVRRIRASGGLNRATPILAFTADAESAFDGRLVGAGFDGVVAKPVDPGQLMAAISAAAASLDAGFDIQTAVA